MAELICNLPAIHVWVRKEYLRDHKDGHGEFVKGVWVSAKSLPGRAFYFETYLPEYAALFDKLPISAFVSRPETPKPDMSLPNLQFWNCMDFGVISIHKQFIGSILVRLKKMENFNRVVENQQKKVESILNVYLELLLIE